MEQRRTIVAEIAPTAAVSGRRAAGWAFTVAQPDGPRHGEAALEEPDVDLAIAARRLAGESEADPASLLPGAPRGAPTSEEARRTPARAPTAGAGPE